jgi:hypothetical protein
MHKHTTRSFSLALGFTLISVFSIPADASNNNASVANCACATTADFVKAARQQAQAAPSRRHLPDGQHRLGTQRLYPGR